MRSVKTNSRRVRVGLLFGGRSGEHEVSLMSARSVLGALDPDRYEVVGIGITKEGRWYSGADASAVLDALDGGQTGGLTPVTFVPQPGHPDNPPLDVVFPVMHGPLGEDGTIQSVLELAEVPYVGAGVAASAVGMDKELMKAAFRAAGLPIVPYQVVRRSRWEREPRAVLESVTRTPGFPAFVKPANLGSSVGVTRVDRPEGLEDALSEAFLYDRKTLVEASAAPMREVECSVLGNDSPQASMPGEIIPGRAFYDYEAKYNDAATRLIIPAQLPADVTERVRRIALQAFEAIDACGMARVDFFVRPTGEVVLNEINTIPGFTAVSMYPKLWEASGLPYPRLVDRLVELALEVHAAKTRLRRAHAAYRTQGTGGRPTGPKCS